MFGGGFTLNKHVIFYGLTCLGGGFALNKHVKFSGLTCLEVLFPLNKHVMLSWLTCLRGWFALNKHVMPSWLTCLRGWFALNKHVMPQNMTCLEDHLRLTNMSPQKTSEACGCQAAGSYCYCLIAIRRTPHAPPHDHAALSMLCTMGSIPGSSPASTPKDWIDQCPLLRSQPR